ncbi:MAG: globin [Bryobacterales bacterium]|nr:globin [Bryobacterales bacterium]
MTPLPEDEIYARIGDEGFARLAAAFYRRIPDDSILGPMYPNQDLVGAERRLRQFLIFRFGGPQAYLEERGHPRLRMRHAPFVVDQAARDRWVELMDLALAEADLPPEAVATLQPFFHHVATFLMNRGSTQPEQ